MGKQNRSKVRRLAELLIVPSVLAGVIATGLATSPALAVEGRKARPGETFLFTVQSVSGSARQLPRRANVFKAFPKSKVDEFFILTLTDVGPVTKFADRPFRDASFISPTRLMSKWDAWFPGSYPNAVLTFTPPGQAPASIVLSLGPPKYTQQTRTLQFVAIRDRRLHDPAEKGPGWRRVTTPDTFTGASLFIDASSDTLCTAADVYSVDDVTTISQTY